MNERRRRKQISYGVKFEIYQSGNRIKFLNSMRNQREKDLNLGNIFQEHLHFHRAINYYHIERRSATRIIICKENNIERTDEGSKNGSLNILYHISI